MPKAVWNNTVIAEAAEGEVKNFDNNIYFPPSALKKEFFEPSKTTTVCSWKGTASYYNVKAGGKTNADCAWYYPTPSKDAALITGHVAFWRGVTVEGPVPDPSEDHASGACDIAK